MPEKKGRLRMAYKMTTREFDPEIKGWRKEFICDNETDATSLPECCTGSTALVAATGKVYIVNASGNWVEFGGEV